MSKPTNNYNLKATRDSKDTIAKSSYQFLSHRATINSIYTANDTSNNQSKAGPQKQVNQSKIVKQSNANKENKPSSPVSELERFLKRAHKTGGVGGGVAAATAKDHVDSSKATNLIRLYDKVKHKVVNAASSHPNPYSSPKAMAKVITFDAKKGVASLVKTAKASSGNPFKTKLTKN